DFADMSRPRGARCGIGAYEFKCIPWIWRSRIAPDQPRSGVGELRLWHPVLAAAPRHGERLPQRFDVVVRRVLVFAQRRLAADGRRDLPDPCRDGEVGLEPQNPANLLEADAIVARV